MNKTISYFVVFMCSVTILLSVYTSATVTDNLGEISIEDSLLNDLKDEIHIVDAVEATLQKSETQCRKDADCHYAGKCTKWKDGLKVCDCRKGTSGSLCQNVEECVANPYKCGNRTDVQCVFDVLREKAVCKCDDPDKEFDSSIKMCRVQCARNFDCQPNGICWTYSKSASFCRCKLGARGDWCQIIDQCDSKKVDCGSGSGVICALGEKGQAYCKCKDSTQGFDFDNKICKDCNCGTDSISCKFENGTKICECRGNYKQRFSECALCDCGYDALSCSFNAAGEKNCTCKPSYIQSRSGKCIGECDNTSGNECENGGTCVDKLCHCPKGTSGDYCRDVDWCENFRCGRYYETLCVYNPETTMGECKCREDNSVYDDNAKKCFECDCGSFGNCIYANGSKICKCQEGYSMVDSKCEKCDCGKVGSISCTKKYYTKQCQCKKYYAPRTGYFQFYGQDTRCDYCNCGEHGKCSFERDDKKCSCDEYYLERSGRCEECFCGYYGTCKFREGDGKKECTCASGYAVLNGQCVRCSCDPPDVRGIGAKCSFVNDRKQCTCPRGFEFTTKYYACEDIDECARDSPCPSSTNCVNIPGSYECECKPGFELIGEDDNPKIYGCRDINECSFSGTCVSSTTRCLNTLGSYDCVCVDNHYATAGIRGDSYVPMYNSCYGEETQWKEATIALVVILGAGGLFTIRYVIRKKTA